jgi:F-type H+-transporting ATPase subunit gamma
MASMRDIKRRIKSVNSTQQITKAMNLVSAAKLQKAKTNLEGTRPFFQKVQQTIASIVKNSEGLTHPYLTIREVKKSAFIVITSDRGLCGGYNANVSKEALRHMADKNVQLITVGKKGRDFFKRKKIKSEGEFPGVSENPTYAEAARIGQLVLDLYTKTEVDEVYVAYTSFKSTIQQEPKVIKLLPVDASKFQQISTGEENSVMNYEPSEEEVLNYVIPRYVYTVLFGALSESAASEQGARMTAMDSATENAYDMIDSLTLKFNRARQASITQELSEIVGGAEALK